MEGHFAAVDLGDGRMGMVLEPGKGKGEGKGKDDVDVVFNKGEGKGKGRDEALSKLRRNLRRYVHGLNKGKGKNMEDALNHWFGLQARLLDSY